jgi:Golgi nucleoside diphosphatase
LYGWIAANYLLGGFDAPERHDHGKGHHTYGFLDMGGASAQIAFAPNATEAENHANDLKLLRMRTLNGQPSEYRVFTATWLGFGVNQARERYVQSLLDASYTHDAKELPDPCLPSGLKTTLKGVEVKDGTNVGKEPVLLGTGHFDECLRGTYPLLDKDAPCEDQPCLLHGQHVPAIDFDVNHFVGVSEYWHTTHSVFKMDNKSYDLATYQQLVKDFCSEEWEDIEGKVMSHKWGKNVDAKTAQEVCFKASWLINVLHEGIGIPRVGIEKSAHVPGFNATREMTEHTKEKGFLDPFQAVDKIDDMEVSWTLGKMVLYAAGQIPPAWPGALPVGFGSNVDGVLPLDFQEAGSSSLPVPVGDDDDWTEAAEDLVEKAHSKSNAGFLIFMLILIVVGYVFRKRERRLRFYRRIDSTFRRSRRPGSPRKGGRSFFGAGNFFGNRSSGSYERVEEGEATEFELGDVESDENENSDSSEGSRQGRTSGLATGKLNVVNFDPSSYFDKNAAKAEGLGLGLSHGGSVFPNAMDRSGLVVRTESREHLGPSVQMLGAGRRSRAGSPTRKSPLMTPLEEV